MTPIPRLLLSATLLLAGATATLRAEPDLTEQRMLYKTTNAALDELQQVDGSWKGDESVVALTGWLDGKDVRKIVAKTDAETTEFYLDEGRPVFVFLVTKKENGKRVEERIYFADGEIVEWLNSDKDADIMHAEDYASFAEFLTSRAKAYSAQLRKAPKEKQAGSSFEGTFSGIQEGDYFHWVMKDRKGEERSFFILQPTSAIERVLADPQEYEGRKCRITFKKSKESLPEAGGEVEIEQIVSVEWL